MILRSLKILNWKCLDKIEIGPLTKPLTIIYAPMKSGKSSLADAIRCTLIDLPHNATEKQIKPFIPWHTEKIPEVIIEFQVGDKLYRILKIFSRGRQGKAELNLISGRDKVTRLANDEEVTGEIQKLIGLDKSSSGIANLLWVRQGSVNLPEMDESGEKALRVFLGGIQSTESDDRVRDLLLEQIKGWFKPGKVNTKEFFHDYAPGSGRIKLDEKSLKSNSDLLKIQEAIEENQEKTVDINLLYQEIERYVQETEKLKVQIYDAEKDLEKMEKEIENLKAWDQTILLKRQKIQELENQIKLAKKEMEEFKTEKEKFAKLKADLEKLQKDHQAKLKELEPLQKERDSLKKTYDEVLSNLRKIEKNATELGLRRSQVEAEKKNLTLEKEIKEILRIKEKASNIENRLEQFQKERNELLLPEGKSYDQIKSLLAEKDNLSAEVKASQLQFSLNPEKVLSAELQIDRDDKQKINISSGEPLKRFFKQKLNLRIFQLGTIEVSRGRENEDVEDLEVKYKNISLRLSNLLKPLGIEEKWPGPEIIAELEKRRSKFQELERDTKEKRKELSELAPDGLSALEGKRKRYETEKENLINSFPELKKLIPSLINLEEEERDLEKAEKEIKKEREKREQERDEFKGNLDKSEQEVKRLSDDLINFKAQIRLREEDLDVFNKKYVSLNNLSQLIAEKEAELKTDEAEFAKHQLTEEENGVAEKLEENRQAEKRLRDHIQELKIQEARIDSELKKEKGLHFQRNVAEEALVENQKRYEQLERTIKTYSLLLKFFDEIRDEGVDTSLKPVSQQVDIWLREMDGEGRKKVIFGGNFQPESIEIGHGKSREINEHSTSFGERELLSTIIRWAYGTILAKNEPQLLILDDPLAHSDSPYHKKMLNIIEDASKKNLQIIIMTCHQERFNHLKDTQFIDLKKELST